MSSARRSAGMLIIGVVALALAAGSAEATDAISGEGLVLEKNVALGSVTLAGQLVLQVRESTRIIAPNGRRITLVELPVARRVSGLPELSADATIRYRGRLVDGKNLADEIRVGVQPPR